MQEQTAEKMLEYQRIEILGTREEGLRNNTP